MSPRDVEEIRRLELRARALRSRRPMSAETARFSECVAEGLRVTGDVIRWMRTGERPGPGVPLARRARVGRFVEDVGLARRPANGRPTGDAP